MTEPTVDVVIPVHTDRRPVARAAASVLATASTDTRLSVVCHNVQPALISAALGTWALDPRVRLLHVEDDTRSPAGPINAGLDAATAEFTAILGSDDEYQPNAIDAWVSVARRDRADAVIPPLRTVSSPVTRSPPVRPFRKRRLDGVRDRLAYRTVQLGLVRRSRFGEVRMTPGLVTGEDVVQGATLWYSGARISRSTGPGYLIHEDDPHERTSSVPKPAHESLQFLDSVLGVFSRTLNAEQRESFAIKLLRTHVMDVLGACLGRGLSQVDADSLRTGIDRILTFSPTSRQIVSRREARIIDELLGAARTTILAGEYALLTDFTRPGNLLPASATKLLHREAAPRFLAAYALMR